METTQLQIAAELDSSNQIIKHFIYGEKINVPDYMVYQGKNYRIISDQVGTPQMIVESESGDIVAKYDYDEFGVLLKKTGDVDIPFGFAGGLYDEDTKLTRFGARDYDAEVGRWTSKDPIGFLGGDTSLYGYVLQDPVNLVDPSGLFYEGDGTNIWNIEDQSNGAIFDFYQNYQDMRDADTIGADKYFHCLANCQASSRGSYGSSTAEFLSDFREFLDRHIKGDSAESCQADQNANHAGRQGAISGSSCSSVCSGFRPRGF